MTRYEEMDERARRIVRGTMEPLSGWYDSPDDLEPVLESATPHWFGPHGPTSRGSGHPIMYGDPAPAKHFDDFPDGGGYPRGFVEWALKEMRCPDPNRVLHLCSGSMRTGVRVDIRECLKPSVVADVRRLPFADESFDFILADPPYSEDYARNLYGTGDVYPTPGEILREAARVLRIGGRVGLLHFLVPMVRRPLALVRVYGVTTGSGYAIRAWSLLEKKPPQLELDWGSNEF